MEWSRVIVFVDSPYMDWDCIQQCFVMELVFLVVNRYQSSVGRAVAGGVQSLVSGLIKLPLSGEKYLLHLLALESFSYDLLL